VINGQTFIPSPPGGTEPFTPTNVTFDPTTGTVTTFDTLMDFFAYESSFRGGVRVAAGDIDGVGRDYVITVPGAGGGPVIKQFDFNNVVGPPSIALTGGGANNGTATRQAINNVGINFGGSATPNRSFFAAEDVTRTGLWVAAGDVNGDGRAEIITGPTTGPAIVRVFDGQSTGLIQQLTVPYEQQAPATGQSQFDPNLPNGLVFQQTPPSGTLLPPTQKPAGLVGGADGAGPTKPFPGVAEGGIRVAVTDWNGDGTYEIVTGAGPGNPPRVRAVRLDGSEVASFLAFSGDVLNGVHVG
jgi:hypothetical protein